MPNKFSVLLYTDYPSKSLDLTQISNELEQLGIPVVFKGKFIDNMDLSQEELETLSTEISSIYISDITAEKKSESCSYNDNANHEYDIFTGKRDIDTKILYEGYQLNRLYFKKLVKKQPDITEINDLHIIYTNRLFCTYGEKRYHARVILMGLLTLISTSGVVEAPAKPREYYWLKAGFVQSGKSIEELDELFKDKYVKYDDPKMTKIIYSYTLQAIFFHLTGKEFCTSKNCCLYNSHWQEEVLKLQYENKLCDMHSGILKNCLEYQID